MSASGRAGAAAVGTGLREAFVLALLGAGFAAQATVAGAGPAATVSSPSASVDSFRAANEQARAGDYPKALAGYRTLAASGAESASLYWNWAQAAAARGAQGEALWALLRGRELEPGDRAIAREVERLREALNLDPAELAPEPLAAVARAARRSHLDLVALGLLAASLLFHALARLAGLHRGRPLAAICAALGVIAAVAPISGSLARPTAAVVRRGAPLYDAASPTAEATGSLREGEVVPILETTGDWLRVEDNAGARGWAHAQDVRRLDQAPRAAD